MFAASKTAAAAAGTPPASTDPQFNYVTMLLHGDGTNGAQNNTFVDSSTNNFTITRNGTPTQGSFSPYGDLWSNQFSGSGQYLTTSSVTFSGDFTVEGWVFIANLSAARALVQIGDDLNANGPVFYVTTAGKFSIFAGSALLTGSATIAANTWVHLAVCRSGSTVKSYVNGVLDATITNSTSFTGVVRVGAEWYNGAVGGTLMNGYISNLRLVTGTALYTSNFTPSTTPLTAVSGTSLLTCQSNRFRDNSSNNFAITVTGTPSVQRFSPFDPAAAYSTSVIGGSGQFSSNTSYLTAASNAAFAFPGEFTVEGWFYWTTIPSAGQITGVLASGGFNITYNTTLQFNLFGTGAIASATFTPVVGRWYHIAMTRNASNLCTVWIDGVSSATGTSSASFVQGAWSLYGGSNNGGAGYVSNLRVVKGTAVYTATFTPPTAPLTAITNTSLLLNTVNAGIVDNAMMNDLVTVGNAQVSTAVKKYGTGSMYFDGTGDWLTTVNSPNFDLSVGSWTIEGWMYVTGGTYYRTMVAKRVASGATCEWEFGVSNTSTLYFYRTGTAVNGSTTVPSNTWVHAAVTYDGTTLRMFQNGTVVFTQAGLTAASGTNNITVGNYGASGDQPWFGYIDDLRITKGYARYTANFTPPTAAFPNN